MADAAITTTQFRPRYGPQSSLANVTKAKGAFYITTDKGRLFFDTTDSTRIEVAAYTSGGGVTIDETNRTITYTLPVATSSILGGIKIGYSASGTKYPLLLDTSNAAYVNVPWTDTKVNYVLNNNTQAFLMASVSTPTTTTAGRTAVGDNLVYLSSTVGQLSAKSFSLNNGASTPAEKVHLIWNDIDQSIDFVFN